jgi:hypothetical protein
MASEKVAVFLWINQLGSVFNYFICIYRRHTSFIKAHESYVSEDISAKICILIKIKKRYSNGSPVK